MADEVLSVELRASTAHAIGEVGKFKTVVREATETITAAGTEQQKLGREIAAVSAKQRDAAEATRAAKQALETHKATIDAFGASSVEAAASAAKLAAAERTATAAAKEANEALAETAAKMTEVATAEGDKLTPATKRAAAQLTRLGESAERTSHELTKMELAAKASARASEEAAQATEQKLVKAHERAGAEMLRVHGTAGKLTAQVDQTGYAMKRGAGSFDILGNSGRQLLATLGPAALGAALIGAASWIGDAAEATQRFETAFANIPFSLDKATKATAGFIAEEQLVASAASASALKVTLTAERFEQLAGASVKLSQKLQQPADQLMNNMVTALGRGSTELLDNAGVVMKAEEAQTRYAKAIGVSAFALTDEQKAAAFKEEGFKAIIAAANETTVAYDSNAAAVVRWKVQVGDAWDSIERSVANAAGAIIKTSGGLSLIFHDEEWIPQITATAAAMDNTWSPAFTRGAESVATFAANLLLAGDAAEVAAQFLNPGNLAEMEAANAKEREKRDILSEEAAFAERAAKALEASEKANAAFLDAQAVHAITYGPEEAPKKKKAGKKQKAAEFSSNSGTNAIVRGFDGVEQTELLAAAAPEAAAEGRAEKEQERYEAALLRYEREAEMLVDRAGLEEETEARRAAIADQQLAREKEHAQWQAQNARTTAQREQALTRVEEVEHRKRVVAAQREAAEEAKIAAARQAQFERIGGAAQSLSASIVAATWEQAQGQKGAIAAMLGDRLKGISIDATVTAAWETAQGVAALAGIYTAGLAPGHFAAAAQAAAVAALAGTAGVAFGAAGKSAAGSAGGSAAGTGGGGIVNKFDTNDGVGVEAINGKAIGSERRAADSGKWDAALARGGYSGRGASGTQDNREPLERSDVPISYSGGDSPPREVHIHISNFTGGKDQAKALGEQVRRADQQSRSQGRRY